MISLVDVLQVVFINIFNMKSFRQYLNEIFRPQKAYSNPAERHPDMVHDDDGYVSYRHQPKDAEGKTIKEKEIHTTIARFSPHHPDNQWEISFAVGGKMTDKYSKEFPSDVTKRVFDHVQHFVETQRRLQPKDPLQLMYDTSNPKKDRIYQKAGKRLGVKMFNVGAVVRQPPISGV